MQYAIAPLANHLWQSTAFVAAVAVVCLALRNHSPRLRYWLWLAASLKFLIPFSVLVSLGANFEPPAEGVPAVQARTVAQAAYAFAPAPVSMVAERTQVESTAWPVALVCLWAFGALGIAAWRFRQWRSLHLLRRRGQPIALAFPAPAVEADSLIEPGIFGIVRPVLLLPTGLRQQLTGEQFETLLAHELCHIRSRDNITAAMHMVVEALFWFFPPVWWIGAKLVAERERACDQSVLAQGSSAEVYATSILNVCRRYLESPLPCAPGITGSDLKARIQEIMSGHRGLPLSVMRKAALAAVTITAVSLPVVIGILRAQTLPPPPEFTYEVVSIRPGDPNERSARLGPGPNGGMRADNVPVIMLLTFAYDVPASQFADVPEWVRSPSDRFDVTFTPDRKESSVAPGMTPDRSEGAMSRQRQRMQAVLRDRFGLVLRAESRELPLYSLTVAKGGSKLTPAANSDSGPSMVGPPGRLTAKGADLSMLTRVLSSLLGRPVADETGLEGKFDFALEWTLGRPMTPPSTTTAPAGTGQATTAGGDGPSIFTALTEQLGLKLDSRRGAAQVLVVEKIERPESN